MLREQLKAKMAELEAIAPKVKEGDAEAIKTAKALTEEIKELKEKINTADEAERLLAQAGFDGEREEGPEIKANSLGANFVAHLKEKELGAHFNVSVPEFVKSYNDVQKTPTTSGVSAFATTYDRNVVTGARTPLVIRDLFAAETISGSTLVYLVEGAIEGAPAATNEGAKKPQVHFADPTPKTVSLAKIAAFIKESDEYKDDYAFLESAINGRLLYHLGLVEQNKLVYDLLNTSGIQSDTTSLTAASTAAQIADVILKEAMDVQEQSGFPADAIVINPTDWYKLRIGKDGENRYYGNGYFSEQSIPNLWGIPVCVTTATSAGTIIVGAFKTCGSVVQKGGVGLDMTNSDQDDFVKNLMTIRAEERLALAVRRPAGFSKIVIGAGGATGATS